MNELTLARNNDLYDAYCKALSEAQHPINYTETVRKAVQAQANRFYISPVRAIDIIAKFRKGQYVQICRERERMYIDIYTRILEIEARNPHLPLLHIIEIVLDQPAPEFYIKTSSAKIILHNEKQRRKELARKGVSAQ